MSAIITDQLRVLNAKKFVDEVTSTNNSYYAFVGLPNATEYSSDWDVSPLNPKDCFDDENDYWDTMIGLSKILPDNARQMVRKYEWESGTIYDMYRNDISSRVLSDGSTKISPQSRATSLYSSTYYVVNRNLQVYICLYNGASPENSFKGNISLDEPTFTDLEPRSAGNSGDGYIWKYLYTITPSDIIKFDSIFYITTTKDWDTNEETQAVRNHATTSGQLKIVTIRNRGVDVGQANTTYTGVPIKGDGSGAEATIVINNQRKVDSILISKGGSGYTYGSVDFKAIGLTADTDPEFDVIIPPKGGHGFDVYRELGASSVLLYTRIENNNENPDFITGNQISRFGVVENPTKYNSTDLLESNTVSAVYALKLKSPDSNPDENYYKTVTIEADSYVTQTIGTASTAVGRVISYDKNTGVLKYWQDKRNVGFNTDGSRNNLPTYGFNQNRFTSSPNTGGSLNVNLNNSIILKIDDTFNGSTEEINNNISQLGQSFINGISNPEVQKYSGNVIYVDNRPSITRSSNQKEDIKVILQF